MLPSSASFTAGRYGKGAQTATSTPSAFAAALAQKLETEHAVHVTRLANDAETFSNDPARNVSLEAALVCGSSCVAPLLELLRGFSRAKQLLLSSRL